MDPSEASTPVPAAPREEQGARAPRTPRRRFANLAPMLLLLGVALLGAASLHVAWKADDRLGQLERELVLRQQESASHSNEARMLAKQAQEGTLEASAKVALLEARLAEVSVQRGQLEELLTSLTRSRDENLIVDIEAEIRVAVQHTAITGSAEPLLAALKQSDDRLARHAQPKFERVRRAIARDLDRVRAAGAADVPSLTIKLDEAIRIVDDLPLLASLESRKATAAPAQAARPAAGAASAPAEPGAANAWVQAWDRAWQRFWGEARSLIRVTRIDQPEALLLAPEQAFFLKENLKLRLLNARLALLSRQFEIAQADLGHARTSLERYYDRGSRRTQLALELVKGIAAQSRQVSVPRPDETFAALAAAGVGR